MPDAYRRAFDDATIRLHAGVVARRADRPLHVEIWQEEADVVAVCVVADDAPGLLARISAAMIAHDIDVVAAQIYGRDPPSGRPRETVGLFWLRPRPDAMRIAGPLRPRELARLGETLDGMVRGHAGAERIAEAARSACVGTRDARVRFENVLRDGATILAVDAADRPGLLFAISDALFRHRVQIARSEVITAGGRAIDRFHLTELDGTPLRRSRLVALQTAVVAAMDDAPPDAR